MQLELSTREEDIKRLRALSVPLKSPRVRRVYLDSVNKKSVKSTVENLPNEEWFDIPEWESYYQISTMGRVKSLDRIVIGDTIVQHRRGVLMLGKISDGFRHVHLQSVELGKNTTNSIPSLMKKVFFETEEGYIIHKNGDTLDDRLENLEHTSDFALATKQGRPSGCAR